MPVILITGEEEDLLVFKVVGAFHRNLQAVLHLIHDFFCSFGNNDNENVFSACLVVTHSTKPRTIIRTVKKKKKKLPYPQSVHVYIQPHNNSSVAIVLTYPRPYTVSVSQS